MTRKLWFFLGLGLTLAVTGFGTLVSGQTPLQPYNPAPFGPGQQNAAVAGNVSMSPAYVATRWYGSNGSTLTTGAALGATTTYCVPYYIRATLTTSNLGVSIGAIGTSNFQVALYNDSGGRPGTLIINSANVVNTSTGFIQVPIASTQLTGPAVIWTCVQNNDATAVFLSNAIANGFVSVQTGAATGAAALGTSGLVVSLTTPGTFGTWPSLSGATWTDQVAARSPAVAIQVASSP
jgi:hypothetical protein